MLLTATGSLAVASARLFSLSEPMALLAPRAPHGHRLPSRGLGEVFLSPSLRLSWLPELLHRHRLPSRGLGEAFLFLRAHGSPGSPSSSSTATGSLAVASVRLFSLSSTAAACRTGA